LGEEQADEEFDGVGHGLDRFQQGTKSDGLILIPLLSFGAQGRRMNSFVLKHAIHRLRKVLDAIIYGAILGMVDQAIENMVVENPCGQDLGDVGGFQPGDKVLLNCWAQVKGNIVENHGSGLGFYYFCVEQFLAHKVRNPEWNPLKASELCIKSILLQ